MPHQLVATKIDTLSINATATLVTGPSTVPTAYMWPVSKAAHVASLFFSTSGILWTIDEITSILPNYKDFSVLKLEITCL